jgi:electron transfer flavoprotein alpha subunit
MAAIWVYAEKRDQTLELLNAGSGPAHALDATLVAFAPDRVSAGDYLDHGADEVLLLPPLAAGQPIEAYVDVFVSAAREADPDVFLVGATPRGKEIAARVAVRLGTGLCGGCIGFEFDEERQRLVMERLLYGGAAVQKVVCMTRPQMATIPPRTFDRAPAGKRTGQGTMRELTSLPVSGATVISQKPRTREAVDITEAKTVVCVGRGVEKEEDLRLARELAGVLGGEVGCTRPMAEELHWLPEEVYLGISGKKIKPDLYVGVGVSGQIQHVTGIRDSKVVVAVNRDENAPIFEAADYGIVGDLYQVVPELVAELKRALNK